VRRDGAYRRFPPLPTTQGVPRETVEHPGQGRSVTDDPGIGKKRVWTPSRVR
jgi:hypothetical protein